jgi:hypothetical protein
MGGDRQYRSTPADGLILYFDEFFLYWPNLSTSELYNNTTRIQQCNRPPFVEHRGSHTYGPIGFREDLLSVTGQSQSKFSAAEQQEPLTQERQDRDLMDGQ